jgi:beta-lactamase regulating signal transducer with metallopeptidase domain
MSLTSDALAQLAWVQFWQVTFVLVAVAAVAKWLGTRRGHLSYLLWMLVILKCLTPPLWSSPTGIFSWAQRREVHTTAADTITPVAVTPSNRETPDASTNSAVGFAMEFEPDGSRQVNELKPRPVRASSVLLMLWLAGVIVTALVFVVRGVRCFAQLRRSACESENTLLKSLLELKQRFGVQRPVRLIVTSEPWGPAVFGVFKPTLVLPESLVSARSAEGMTPILAHELVHVRRGDTLFGILQLFAQILWWFHPLVWWANRQMNEERERLCDEETIAGLELEQENYAQSLLDVLKFKQQLRSVPLVPGVRGLDITRKRLEHIMNLPETIFRRMPWAYWLVLAIGAAVLLPGAGLTSIADDKSSSNKTEAAASTGTLRISKTKDEVPIGSGLIHQLPQDKTRAHFDMNATVEREGRASEPLKGEIAISSVGREVVNGVPCRWIEFSVGSPRSDPERSKPAISKLLIPEERLISGSDPLDHIIKGWSQGGAQEQPHAVGPRMAPQDGPLFALLPGKMKDVKRLKNKPIETSLGTLECSGLAGSIDFQERGHDVTITFEIYRHKKAPFGVVSYRMQIETKEEDKILRKANLHLALRDVTENVQSELPDSALLSALNEINAVLADANSQNVSGEQEPDELDRRAVSNSLKTLGIAIQNYHGVHGILPAAASLDTKQKKLLSWRVHILPFVDERELYNQFRLYEAWDSAHNKPLIEKIPRIFAAGSKTLQKSGKTVFLAPIGKNTSIGSPDPVRFQDITDGVANTILVMTVNPEHAVEWTRPADWELDEKNPFEKLTGQQGKGFMVGLCDGSALSFRKPLTLDLLKALLTRSGGDKVSFF